MTIAVFSNEEVNLLKKIWIDLSDRNNGMGINKDTFLLYIPMNGLLGERLYSLFDDTNAGHITYDKFIKGLELLCLGTIEEQVQFFFKMCDVENIGLVHKEDLVHILNCIPSDVFLSHTSRKSPTIENNDKLNSALNLTSNATCEYKTYTNHFLCDDTFSDGKNITYDEFSDWIRHIPAIFGYIKSIIPCMSEKVYSKNSSEESYLYKKGEKTGFIIKRYASLKDNYLYYYVNQNDSIPKGVIFLEGSLIKQIDDPIMENVSYYGFEINQQNMCTGEYNHHDKRILYCDSREKRNEWVKKLQQNSHRIPFHENYIRKELIGHGSFSKVYKCICKQTNELYAVKIIDKSILVDEEMKSHIKNEIAVLKLVNHPFVIHLHDVYEDEDHFYIIIELIEDGDFFDFISNHACFKDDELKPIMKQLIEALAYLHDYGIAHCDIKPENILYDKNTNNIIKLTDFGLSKMLLSNQKINMTCGTLSYVAPECLKLKGYGMEADMWSVGIIMYLLVYGKLLYDGDTVEEIYNKVINEPVNLKPKISSHGTDLLYRLLDKNPDTRITADEALIHPFFYE